MRTRTMSTVLGATLVASGLAVGFLAPAATAADAPSTRLYLHGTAATYQADAAADPGASAGRAPKGVTATSAVPTGTTTKTGAVSEPGGDPGLPNAPTFALAVSGTLKTACIDLFLTASNPGATFPVYAGFGEGDPETGTFTYADSVKATTAPGIVRLTTLLKLDPTPYESVEGGTFFLFLSAFDTDSTKRPYTIHYDSVTAYSNIILNPTTCTPAPAPPQPAPSASASASTAPSASASAAPSTSATPTASTSASAAPSGSVTAAPSGSATASASTSASSSPSAAPSPNCPTTSGSADPSASTAPSTSGSAAPSTSATAAASGSASAAPSTSGSAVASASASAPAASGSADPSASASPGGGGISSEASCRASTVTLAADVLQITAGNTPTLSGVVRDERGDAIEGATVTIFTKGYGETRYTAAATLVTNAAGQYSISVRPLKQTAYGANVGNARSPVLNIRVSTRVNITRPVPGAVNNPVTFTGTLNPGYARVAVGLGYLVNGRFVVLKQADTNGTGGYSITATLPRGTFAFVVFTSAHQGTDKGSKSVRLTVR